jgi:uncharacterized protein (DUF427 family)
MKALYKNVVIAESEHTIVVEGNHYFPAESLHRQYFKESSHRSFCPWKGEAFYYSVVVGDETNENAAWYYPDALEKAKNIEGAVAFWKGVRVE